MRLLWNDGLIPRSTTRGQWREMNQWRRKTAKILRANEAENLALLTNLVAYGTTHPEITRDIRREMMDRAVNPPLLLGPMFS